MSVKRKPRQRHNVLRIEIDGQLLERMNRFGAALPKIMSYSMGDVAHDMAAYIRSGFLTGDPLGQITGETHGSTRAYQAAKGERGWFVDFGVGVKGHLNYLYRWKGTRRDFLTRGSRNYATGDNYMRLVEENLERMGRKLEVM